MTVLHTVHSAVRKKLLFKSCKVLRKGRMQKNQRRHFPLNLPFNKQSTTAIEGKKQQPHIILRESRVGLCCLERNAVFLQSLTCLTCFYSHCIKHYSDLV